MLKEEIGLDIDSVLKAPTPLSSPLPSPHYSPILPENVRSESPTNLASCCRPLSWIKGKFSRNSEPNGQRPPYEGEPQEERHDAISPIFDQLDMHWYWRWMEHLPCESSPSRNYCQRQ